MKLVNYICLLTLLFLNIALGDNFEKWKNEFKILALSEQISEKTFNLVMNNAIFLPKVIEYDRF